MRPGSSACSEAGWALLLGAALLWPAGRAAHASEIEPREAAVIAASDATPPRDADPRWTPVRLPDSRAADIAWYRVEFDRPAQAKNEFWLLYLPFFYGGGQVVLNDQLVAPVLESSPTLRVRWERPLLLPLPSSVLRDGRNVLVVRAVSADMLRGTGLPRLVIGSQVELQHHFDRRLFWVRTVPLVSVACGSVVGLFVIFIWLRRRSEVLYGLFGLATLLWALRTTTFVFDALPADWWRGWRLLYHASTGGFVVVMALFSLALAGWYRRWIAQALGAYWLLGPLIYALAGDRAEDLVARVWVAGLIPIGVAMVCVTVMAAWRQRTAGTFSLTLALTLAVLAGVHDYLIAWRDPLVEALAPTWSEHRIFLLHHASNLLLIVMGALLTARFVRALQSMEEMNRTLEARVAEREGQMAASYERIASLQRDQAATDERQRIMQDLHDGLGSQLFTSLLQVERGALSPTGIAEVLRGCIADMRLALEAFASDEHDFRTALGNFMFRWDSKLREAGVAPAWQIDAPEAVLAVPPHTTLQVLRVLQEALTNVLKHAQAASVRVALTDTGASLRLQIEDDGRGIRDVALAAGRGMGNMRSRARRLGATLDVASEPGRTCLTLTLPAPL